MGRPKGFVPEPCSECTNKGRHKVTCSKSSVQRMEPREAPWDAKLFGKAIAVASTPIRPYKRHEETPDDSTVEGGLADIYPYHSLKQDYRCACGDLLEMGRNHWTDKKGNHLCMSCARDVVRRVA